MNVGITCPTVAAGGSNKSRKLPLWLLLISVLFGILTRMTFLCDAFVVAHGGGCGHVGDSAHIYDGIISKQIRPGNWR